MSQLFYQSISLTDSQLVSPSVRQSVRDSGFQAVGQFYHPLTQLTIRIHDSTQASNYAVQSF